MGKNYENGNEYIILCALLILIKYNKTKMHLHIWFKISCSF